MSLRRLLLVLLALCVSGGTVLVGRMWFTPPRVAAGAAAPAPAATTPQVLVAKGDLAAGQFVRAENLRWQNWPAEGVSPAYSVEGKTHIEDFVGSVVRSAIGDGEPITADRIVRPGDRGFLAAVLTPGYRAVTVPVTVSSGLAGFVFPGDRVDLLLTMTLQPQDKDKLQRHAAETLLTDLRVLAVDQRTDDRNKDVVVEKTATLEVTPKQAETIAVASDIGTLSLSLRSLAKPGSDDESTPPYSHTWDSEATHLIAPPDAQPKPANPQVSVSVVRGDDVKVQLFGRSLQ